jgi:hypothetical protein
VDLDESRASTVDHKALDLMMEQSSNQMYGQKNDERVTPKKIEKSKAYAFQERNTSSYQTKEATIMPMNITLEYACCEVVTGLNNSCLTKYQFLDTMDLRCCKNNAL